MTLYELISNKAFEQYQNGLGARFAANQIEYLYRYNLTEEVPSLTVWLNHGNIPATISISEDGKMYFSYFHNGRQHKTHFINCNKKDFHMMLAHAFLYLRDGNFNHHKEWYEALMTE